MGNNSAVTRYVMQNDAYAPALPTIVRVTSSHSASEKGRCNKLCYAIHEFHETCHSVTFYFMKKDSKICCDTAMPESIHTKDESKRGSAFAFISGVN